MSGEFDSDIYIKECKYCGGIMFGCIMKDEGDEDEYCSQECEERDRDKESEKK